MRILSIVLACAALACATRDASSPAGPPPTPPPPVVAATPASVQPAPVAAASPTPAIEHPGCFLLHDVRAGTVVRVHPEACARATVPASTFKIPHSLIALQTGVVTDPEAERPWDGRKHWNEAWQRPHSLATAIRHSVLWFFQGTAKQIGRARMQAQLAAIDYGNAAVTGELTTFWLDGGSLRVTGDEQLDFLLRMFRRELPIDRAHVDTVERLLLVDRELLAGRLPPGATMPDIHAKIHAKTGTDTGLTWWVGKVEGPRGEFVFVSRVEDDRPASSQSPAVAAGLQALAQAGVL